MVVFNISAFLQALIIVIILGIFYLVGFNSFFEGNGILQMYFIHLVVAFTYKAGMKGRLFWIIPTWLISLCFVLMAVMLFSNTGMNETVFKLIKGLNYFIILFLAYRMIFGLNADFVKEFRNANLVLKNINKTEEYFEQNKKEFWIQISHTFVYPNRFFLYGYPAYKIIFRNSVTQQDFAEHYRMLIDLIKDRLTILSNRAKLGSLSFAVDNYLKTGEYSHSSNSLKNIAEVIDLENKATT
ncbi:hypothetical protein [Flavobacterium sp.]|uniref:hypothetical protein n=1 Tax=Flavobacterium sp. TaxID=239 RepID=UPI00391B0238